MHTDPSAWEISQLEMDRYRANQKAQETRAGRLAPLHHPEPCWRPGDGVFKDSI